MSSDEEDVDIVIAIVNLFLQRHKRNSFRVRPYRLPRSFNIYPDPELKIDDRKMDLDPWVSCPYNKTHRVPQSRIQAHIVKCEKQYPKLAICPYNATHRMPEAELKSHVTNCPARMAMYPESIGKERVHGDIRTPKPYLQRDILPETDPDNEDWDD